MRNVFIAGVGLTSFGKQLGRGVRSLAIEAVDLALTDAGVQPKDVQGIFFGNASAGVVSQQEMIRGQVALRHHPLGPMPLINVENACASGGTALHLAFEAVLTGRREAVLAVGVEQMHHQDKMRTFHALHGSTDVEEIGEYVPGELASHSILMDFYAGVARDFMQHYGATAEDFARVAVKNRLHASMNPIAQFRTPQTLEDVMSARCIVEPLTMPMCAPTTDGACALLVCSEEYLKKLSRRPVRVLTCQISGSPGRGISPVIPAAHQAYEAAGLGPNDMQVIELHDAAAPAELLQYSEIGLCPEGEGHLLVRSGATQLGGRIPINTSGGLLSRGHALGATGCAQVGELVQQLRGEAGKRQVEGAQRAMAINGGGWLDNTYAVTVATIMQTA